MTSELITEYRRLRDLKNLKCREIKEIDKKMEALVEAMPKLYYVKGHGIKPESSLSEGIHFAAKSFEECESWVLDNYPEFEMVTPHQFSRKTDNWGAYVDGEISECTPISENWHEVSLLLK